MSEVILLFGSVVLFNRPKRSTFPLQTLALYTDEYLIGQLFQNGLLGCQLLEVVFYRMATEVQDGFQCIPIGKVSSKAIACGKRPVRKLRVAETEQLEQAADIVGVNDATSLASSHIVCPPPKRSFVIVCFHAGRGKITDMDGLEACGQRHTEYRAVQQGRIVSEDNTRAVDRPFEAGFLYQLFGLQFGQSIVVAHGGAGHIVRTDHRSFQSVAIYPYRGNVEQVGARGEAFQILDDVARTHRVDVLCQSKTLIRIGFLKALAMNHKILSLTGLDGIILYGTVPVENMNLLLILFEESHRMPTLDIQNGNLEDFAHRKELSQNLSSQRAAGSCQKNFYLVSHNYFFRL